MLCLEAGGVTTEVGRQPWVVYEVLRTADAVSAAPGLRVGYYLLVVVYGLLTVATIAALVRIGRIPLPARAMVPDGDDEAIEPAAPDDGAAPPVEVSGS